MNQNNEGLGVLVEQQLQFESGVADALEALNDEMASLLADAGIYGPKQPDLKELSPLLETLQSRYSESHKARQRLQQHVGTDPTQVAVEGAPSLKTMLSSLPAKQSTKLDATRQRIHDRMRDAHQKLTANQVVIFYSTEFHRRYLLGVLQCDVDEANYQADGQAFKLPPEKIIGRNC